MEKIYQILPSSLKFRSLVKNSSKFTLSVPRRPAVEDQVERRKARDRTGKGANRRTPRGISLNRWGTNENGAGNRSEAGINTQDSLGDLRKLTDMR